MTDWLVHHITEIENLKSRGSYDEAKKRVESLLVTHTDDYRLYEELADIYLFLGDMEKAESSVKIASSLNSESATGLYLSGYIAVTKGDFIEGIDLLDRANKGFPNNPEILRNLGWAYVVTGEVSRGVIFLKRALNLAPDDELIMEDLGVALLSDGEHVDEGEALLRKAGKAYRIQELKDLMRI